MSRLASLLHRIEHAGRWKWFLVFGIVLIILGIAGVSVAPLLETASVLIIGPMLLVSSLMELLLGFFAGRGRERLLHYIAAGLEAAFGFLLMANPIHSVRGLVVPIAIIWIVLGVDRLARSWITNSKARAWIALAGLVAILLGISLLLGWSPAKLWVIGLLIGVDFICHGISWTALALTEPSPRASGTR
jgi:uncharacterized membrane protein HdeD (DUF308 family)